MTWREALDNPLTCVCCGATEGGNPSGGAVDPVSGLCITCQPCPACGKVTHDYEDRCPEAPWD